MAQHGVLAFERLMRSLRKILGKRLKELREQNGLRPIEVAAHLAVNVSHLYHIESGDAGASLEVLEALAMIYKVDLADLFTFPETHPRHAIREMIRNAPTAKLGEIQRAIEAVLSTSAAAPARKKPAGKSG